MFFWFIKTLAQSLIPLPTTNKLYQNYPNPFNPNQEVTKIPYDLTDSARIEIKIFNIAGELTRRIEESRISAGSYEAIWDGRNDDNDIVSNGVYFYQLHIGGSVVGTKKILVIK
ncbi:MAG: FlgD immunoglobulin-like domain containing protein [bacterium]